MPKLSFAGLHVAQRAPMAAWKAALLRVAAVLLALVVGGLILLCLGYNPLLVYQTMLNGALAKKTARASVVRNAVPLAIVALGVTLAFKMKFWNIGAEGQICIGAIAASFFAYSFDWPSWLLLTVMAVAGFIAGGLWGLIPAIFKTRFGTNETLFTLMMNYIATQLVAYFIIIWEVPKGSGKIGIINQDTQAGWLPTIGNQKYLLAILVVAILTGLMYIYLNYSKHGYEIAVVGESRRTASYAGIKVDRVIIRTMALSGALCGLIGLLLTSSTDHTMTTTIVDGRGFTAVMVSWMAKFNPVIMIFVSLLLVVLSRGASEISTAFGLNRSFSDILTGIILFFIIGCEFFINYKVQFRSSGKKEA